MAEASEQPWPPFLAAVTATVAPTITARRTLEVRLLSAAVVHLVGLAMIAAAAVTLRAWNTAPLPLSWVSWWESFERVVRFDLPRLWSEPQAMVALGMGALGLEAGLVVAGWLLMSWGARPEPIGAALARSLKRLWLLTPHAALLVVLAGGLAVSLDRAHRASWDRWNQQGLTAPSATSPTHVDEYSHAYNRWTAAVEAYEAQRPWWLRHRETLVWAAGWLTIAWALVLVLRVQGLGSWGARCRWPAVCEGCGYELTGLLDHLRPEHHCPECGRPVLASVGSHVRSGVAWQKPWRHERWRAYREAVVDPVRRPTAFGARLRALWPTTAHRRLFAGHAAVVLAMGPVAVVTANKLWQNFTWSLLIDMTNRGLTVGLLMVVAMVLVTVGSASVVGASATRAARFPLMPVAIQGACYLSGFVVVWAALTWAMVGGVLDTVIAWDLLEQPAAWVGLDERALAEWLFLTMQVVMLGIYGVLLRRIVLAARLANW